MYQIAIVEDDDACAKQIQDCLKMYAAENALEFRVDRFCNGLNVAEDYKAKWDLILMDIELPLMDGMTAAHRIREKDDTVLLIFVTNMAKYGFAFRSMALPSEVWLCLQRKGVSDPKRLGSDVLSFLFPAAANTMARAAFFVFAMWSV